MNPMKTVLFALMLALAMQVNAQTRVLVFSKTAAFRHSSIEVAKLALLKIGSENKKISLADLKELVINEIKNGKAQIIKRNKQEMYVECNDQIIDMQLYKGKWFVPKCLVPSN